VAAIDSFGYADKRVLVVGGASGIGAATVELVAALGAEVVVADYAEVGFDVAKKIALDLRDDTSIEAAVEMCGAPVDALFSCAGISEGPDMMRVNFIGQRYLIERCVAGGLMPSGSAVGIIASGAGMGWQQNLAELIELVDTPDTAAAEAWCAARPATNNYAYTKQAVIAYCARRALALLAHGVRINALCPSSTDTPLARRSPGWLEYGTDYREAAGIDVARPEDQAYPLAFLCSEAAGYITGTFLSVDAGVHAARVTGTFLPKTSTEAQAAARSR
jgi:NAD(P)-dependent dehydrogenase (short-subunit alcohol dehydrogenase family)